MYCNKCGAELPEGTNICGKCGEPCQVSDTQSAVPKKSNVPIIIGAIVAFVAALVITVVFPNINLMNFPFLLIPT